MLLTKLKILLVVVFMLGLGSAGIIASNAQDDPPGNAGKHAGDKLKDTLLELDKRMWDAATKGDTKTMRMLMADDYVSIWAVDDRTDRGTALETAKRYRYSDRTMRDIEVRVVSKDAAVLTYVCSYKVSVDNEEPRTLPERRVSTVWGKRNGRWVVVFAQAASGGE